MQRLTAAIAAGLLVALAACGDDAGDAANTVAPVQSASSVVSVPSTPDAVDPADAVVERLDQLDRLMSEWAASSDIASAHAAAEAAANLIVGPYGPGYGDRDGDGELAGANERGLLPGLEAAHTGLASPLASTECVARDVLAGTVDNPPAAWQQMADVIAAWTHEQNTMPQLASHPMRTVGWATLTLGSDDLDEAHEFASHAAIHVRVSQEALGC